MKLFDVYPLFDIEPVKAKGAWIWDSEGNKYLDLYGGHAVISIGHTHDHYVKMLSDQLNKVAFYSNSVVNKLQNELADKLGELSGYVDYSLFLCNSGAEANENAMKLASFSNGRKKVIAFSKGFHGRTSLAVASTDNKNIQAPVNEFNHITILPLNDIDAIKEHLNEDVSAVIIEGIQGVAGVNIPNDEFLKELEKLCKEKGAYLILDEVQSGYGRSGKFFAHQYSGIKPDIITVAKGMGNGFPIGGVLIAPTFEAKHGMLGTTFGGNHLACAAGIAVLDVMKDEGLMDHANKVGDYIIKSLDGLPGIREIRARGLMIGIELDDDCADIRKELISLHRVFTGSSGNKNTLRLLPPLNLTIQEAEIFISTFKSVLTKHFAVSHE